MLMFYITILGSPRWGSQLQLIRHHGMKELVAAKKHNTNACCCLAFWAVSEFEGSRYDAP